MTEYKIVIERPAEKFIVKLPRPEKERVLRAIAKLPNEGDIKKLKGHADLLRLRVGDYRIIYTVDHGELIGIMNTVDINSKKFKHGESLFK